MDVLYFEPTDEVTKAIERVRDSQSAQVALVLPRGSLILQSIVNLKLIARMATTSKKELAIVTVDKIGRNLALQVGIPVYGKIEGGKVTGKVLQKNLEPVTPQSVRQKALEDTEEITTVTGIQVHRYDANERLNNLTEQEPEVKLSDPAKPITPVSFGFPPTEPSAPDETAGPTGSGTITHLRDGSGKAVTRRLTIPPRTKKLILAVVIIVIAAALSWLWWAFPNTAVTLQLQGEKKDVSANFTAGIETVANRELPLTAVSITKEGTKTVPTTGSKNVGEKATGTITLINQYSNSTQTVPAGTVLQTTDSKRFTTNTGVVIPGAEFSVEGSTSTLKTSGRVDVSITAAESGEDYNLSSGRLTLVGISDQKDNKVYGDGPKTAGGTNQTIKLVSAADVDGARSQLVEQLTSDASNDAVNQTQNSELLKEATATEVLSFSADANPGDERDQVTVSAKIALKVLALDKAALTTALTERGKVDIGDNKIFSVRSEDVSYTVSAVSNTAGSATISAQASGSVAANVDQTALLKQLRGKSDRAATAILEQTPLYQSVAITHDPAWFLSRIANRAQSTTLTIEYGE